MCEETREMIKSAMQTSPFSRGDALEWLCLQPIPVSTLLSRPLPFKRYQFYLDVWKIPVSNLLSRPLPFKHANIAQLREALTQQWHFEWKPFSPEFSLKRSLNQKPRE
jgi:hypothetical protein